MKLPKWLKPELNDVRYWIHLYVIAIVILGILQFTYGGEMLTVKNVFFSTWLILAGDIVAHTLLKLD